MKKYILLLVEGETECTLLEALDIKGKCKIFNLWENKVESLIRSFQRSRKYTIYIFFDTDKTVSIDCFKNNLKKLSQNKIVNEIFLLQQTKNLEDELQTATGLNMKGLCELIACRSQKDFKSDFNQKNISKIIKKIQLNKIWCGEFLETLKEFEAYKRNGSDLPTNY